MTVPEIAQLPDFQRQHIQVVSGVFTIHVQGPARDRKTGQRKGYMVVHFAGSNGRAVRDNTREIERYVEEAMVPFSRLAMVMKKGPVISQERLGEQKARKFAIQVATISTFAGGVAGALAGVVTGK
ncbi:hypothetical protein [Arthrobacter sp. OY3WO11]|uniref:hypothetical protein n=1 Tax=Arthrobacter sp. OY3WO11 TaxID=1835723 RepID=UPI0007D00C44|nr:hypothetical protein [Arthrobacter sp. OY3WO11]OAE01970.1 hypothetical protein A6A22_11445 [Arthrobacter sp. OY3WO11]